VEVKEQVAARNPRALKGLFVCETQPQIVCRVSVSPSTALLVIKPGDLMSLAMMMAHAQGNSLAIEAFVSLTWALALAAWEDLVTPRLQAIFHATLGLAA